MEGRRRRQSRRPEARGWLRSGGKGREGAVRLIPSHGSGGDGLSWPGRDGVRRRAAADMRRRCSACSRPGFEGKRGWGAREVGLPTLTRARKERRGGRLCDTSGGGARLVLAAALGEQGGGGGRWHCSSWGHRGCSLAPFIGGQGGGGGSRVVAGGAGLSAALMARSGEAHHGDATARRGALVGRQRRASGEAT